MQEEREHQFGRLFGAESIIKSGILFQPSVEIENWDNVLDIIYELAKKKSWLREECGFILFNSTQVLKDKEPRYAQLIIDKLLAYGLSKTSQGVAIWTGIQAAFPSIDFPQGVWHKKDPLNRKDSSRLIQILMEAPTASSSQEGTELEATAKGVWASKLPFAWDVILAELLNVQSRYPQKNTHLPKRIKLITFWEECIDSKSPHMRVVSALRMPESFFAASSSEERKYWGLLLFQRMINEAPVKMLSGLFTTNLMRCLINQLASPERYLHRVAETSTKAIIARARSNSDTKALFLEALLNPIKGDINFDKTTRTKTIETLGSLINDPTFKQVIEIYEDLFLRPEAEDEKVVASRRQSAAEQLVSAVRSAQLDFEENMLVKNEYVFNICRILALLAKYAYFDVNEGLDDRSLRPRPKVSQATRDMFRTRVSSCLSSLMTKSTGEPSYFAFELVCDIDIREEDPGHPESVLNADDTVRRVLKDAWRILGKVHTSISLSSDSEARFLRALELLYSLTILQVYNEEADAVGILAELNHNFKPLLRQEQRPRDSATLVEILLSFIAKPSQLFRRLAEQVFMACASELDYAALQSMMKVRISISYQDSG